MTRGSGREDPGRGDRDWGWTGEPRYRRGPTRGVDVPPLALARFSSSERYEGFGQADGQPEGQESRLAARHAHELERPSTVDATTLPEVVLAAS
jgi:hypothetical protein